MSQKENIRKRFNALAKKRQYWKERNMYYYSNQEKYFRFLIPEGLSILELGCATGELLNALKPKRGVGIDLSVTFLRFLCFMLPFSRSSRQHNPLLSIYYCIRSFSPSAYVLSSNHSSRYSCI